MSRRSKNIEIGFVAVVAAAALTGCNPQQAYHRDWEQCVDQNNVVVNDQLCDQSSRPGGYVGGGGHYYHWWYSPRPYYPGEVVSGGYATPRANMQVARASSASRGGFGSSAHGGSGE
jgi:hypothetical protein